jgi:hypothetical protein
MCYGNDAGDVLDMNVEDFTKLNSKDKKKQGKGMGYIISTITEQDQHLILDYNDVKSTVDRLKKLHVRTENLYTLENELTRLEWRGDTADVFIGKVNQLRNRFKQVEEKTDDMRFVHKILDQMPHFLNSVKQFYENEFIYKKIVVDYEQFIERVVEAYNNKRYNRNGSNSFNRNERNNNRSDRADNSAYYVSGITCFNCGQQGHKSNRCPNPKKSRHNQVNERFNRNRQNRNNNIQRNESNRSTSQQTNDDPANNNTSQQNSTQTTSNDRNNTQSNSSNNNNNRSNRGSSVNTDFINSAYCMFKENSVNEVIFYLDNCCLHHIVNDLTKFVEYEPFENPITIAGCGVAKVLGKGIVPVASHIRGEDILFNLKDVYYIPSMKVNIVSQVAAQNSGIEFELGQDKDYWYTSGFANGKNGRMKILVARSRKSNKEHYRLSMKFNQSSCFLMDTEWHEILGHAPIARLIKTSQHVEGMSITRSTESSNTCAPCVTAKSKQRTFNHSLLKETVPGRVLHSDINELPKPSLKGAMFAIYFVDEASRYTRVYFLKNQSALSIKNAINECLADQRSDIDTIPVRLHTDRGTGYLSSTVKELLLNHNIQLTTSTAHNKGQNGLSEKTIQDTMMGARAALFSSKLPTSLWAEALHNTVYITNRLYKESLGMTPYEVYFGHKPDVRHIKKFGQPVLIHIPKVKRDGKLDYRAREGRIVGHTNSTVNYRVVNANNTVVTVDCNLHFIKEDQSRKKRINNALIKTPNLLSTNNDDTSETDDTSSSESDENAECDNSELNISSSNLNLNEQNEDNRLIELTTNEANKNESFNVITQHYEYLINEKDIEVPKSIKDVMNNKHADLWLEACDEEYLSFLAHDVFEPVQREDHMNVLRGHWLFSKKSDSDGKIIKLKARYVIDGSSLDGDYYSPVIDKSIIRLLLCLAMQKKWYVHVVDIKTAYLNSKLDEDIYMQQIPLYHIGPNIVLKLKGSLYGLKQSSLNWYNTIKRFFIEELKLVQSDIEPCLFYKLEETLFVLLYVDDMQIISDELAKVEQYKQVIKNRFDLKDAGHIKQCIGIRFDYDRERRVLKMDQQSKIEQLYEKHKINCPAPTKLPIPQKEDIYKFSEDADVFVFQSIIGSLNYIAHATRPDIMVYVNKLSQFLKSPKQNHLYLAYKLISYLNHTKSLCLKYNCEQESNILEVYTDASNQDIENTNGKYTSGVVVQLNGNAIQWVSKKQTIVSGEICEGELYALNYGLKAGLFYRNILDELSMMSEYSYQIKLYCDNSSSIDISNNGLKKNSKHYANALLYIKDFMIRQEIDISKISSKDNLADLFTKFTSHSVFKVLCKKLKLKRIF